MSFALPSIGLVAAAGAMTQDVDLAFERWLALVAVLWFATAAFAALGVLVGVAITSQEGAQSAAGLTLIVLWVLGGMVTTPSDLPGMLETLAHAMPTNGAAELGWATARGDTVPIWAVAVLVSWTLAAGALAALTWRRLGGSR